MENGKGENGELERREWRDGRGENGEL
jgi:hypothetical protein